MERYLKVLFKIVKVKKCLSFAYDALMTRFFFFFFVFKKEKKKNYYPQLAMHTLDWSVVDTYSSIVIGCTRLAEGIS